MIISEDKKPSLLFLCNSNIARSPTAKNIFSSKGFRCDSDSVKGVSKEKLFAFDYVIVMERKHLTILQVRFPSYKKNIILLDLPDVFEYMQPSLIRLIELKMKDFFVSK